MGYRADNASGPRTLTMTRKRTALFPCLCLVALLTTGTPGQESFDVIIRGGRVVDGTGNPWVRADVGIRGDRIARIGDLSGAAAELEIDAEGLVVSPGFIDPHTHASRGIFQVPTADNVLLQGVTTLTEGNDGSSPLPIGEHLEQIERTGISPNWAVFVGQGTVRTAVMGRDSRPATSAELATMRDLVSTAMEEGALGLSTGLFYVPGTFTPTEEVIDLATVVAGYGGIYISHMRDEASGLLDSVRETIRIGEEAGLPVQMTHHKALGKHGWGTELGQPGPGRRGAGAWGRRHDRPVSVYRLADVHHRVVSSVGPGGLPYRDGRAYPRPGDPPSTQG